MVSNSTLSVHCDQQRTFYIWSPDFTHLHSGVRCLFLLCHHLNRLGHQAFITGKNAPADLLVQHVDADALTKQLRRQPGCIAIYPEIVAGNPLRAKRVVRYLLNKPGVFNDTTADDYGAHDYVVHFAPEFQEEKISSRQLKIPLVDHSVFNRQDESCERHGYLLYAVRYKPDLSQIPKWAHPSLVISRDNIRAPSTLALLYKSSKALIVWERTAAVGEALHCGCPVLVIPRSGFDHETIVRGSGGGVAIGWDEAAIEPARATLDLAIERYAAEAASLDKSLNDFVREAYQYFDELSPVRTNILTLARRIFRKFLNRQR